MSLSELTDHVGKWVARVPAEILAELDSINPKGRLKDGDLKVYIALTTWGRGHGEVWARRSVIARYLNMSARNLRRHVKRLENTWAIYLTTKVIKGEPRSMIVVVNADDYVRPGAGSKPGPHRTILSAPDNLVRTTGQSCPPDRTELSPIRKSKKEEKEKKRVSTFVETKSSLEETNGMEKHEPDSKGKKEDREKRDREKKEQEDNAMKAGSSGGNYATFAEPEPGGTFEQPPAKSGGSKPRKPRAPKPKEISDPKIIALHEAYVAEIKLKWPNTIALSLNPMKAKLIRGLLDQTDHKGLLEIIRVAVWDWTAIQETVQPWYTKEREMPDYKTLTFIFDQLAVLVGKGKTSTRNRTSDYHRRYVSKNLDNSSKDASGLSLAERSRRKLWAKQELWAEEEQEEQRQQQQGRG